MNTRYNYKWKKPEKVSTPIKEEYELITVIEPISFNEDKTVKEYKEISKYVVHKSKWSDFIKSYDLGSPSDQVLDHLTKGTPLITAHTLPPGDYRKETLLKSYQIAEEMKSKGISLEMIEAALASQSKPASSKEVVETKPVAKEGEQVNG